MMAAFPRFLVVDVGCLECGERTSLVGAYWTRESAMAAQDNYGQAADPGSHMVVILEVTPEKVDA